MKVAVIGAGLAGLVSLKHCLDEKYAVDMFEQTGVIGGIWNYFDGHGVDEMGIPIYAVMYKDLTTNLPKDLMTLDGFPYPDVPPSYLSQPRVLQYFQDYAKYFKLLPHIRFYSQVIKVEPIRSSEWKLTIKNIKTNSITELEYDVVMICNGHYNRPQIPIIPGMDIFKGKQMHSSIYRMPNEFKDKRVLIIGAGSSGIDIGQKILKVAKKVVISYKHEALFKVPEILPSKPLVKQIYENGVLFEDGTVENFDVIIYCTGYLYDFPFLTDASNIKLDNRWIKYLYKNVINVLHPTMAFIGITWECCVVPVAEAQVRFYMAFLKKTFKLPSEAEMMQDIENHLQHIKSIGWTEKHMHRLGVEQGEYFNNLTTTANINRIPPVIHKLYLQVRKDRGNPKVFYKIIDDENFTQILL